MNVEIKASKTNVPYYAIVSYAAFVIVASLLVGILPPFVNRPPCKENTLIRQENYEPGVVLSEKTSNLLERVNKKIADRNQQKETILEDPNVSLNFSKNSNIYKSRSTRKNTKNILERFKDVDVDNPVRSSFFKEKVKNPNKELSICPEIASPVVGTFYPWNSERLPDYIMPSKYNIELYVPQW